MVGSGARFYAATNVRHACNLGARSISDHPCGKILDGAERLSRANCRLEITSRRGNPGRCLFHLRLCQRNRARRLACGGLDVSQDFGSTYRARVSSHGAGRVDPLSLRIFSFSGSRHCLVFVGRFYFAYCGAGPISSRRLRRALVARSCRWQAPGPGGAAHHLVVPFVPAGKRRIALSIWSVACGQQRFFRYNFAGQRRGSRQLFRGGFPGRVS